jgi:hypothetical protein
VSSADRQVRAASARRPGARAVAARRAVVAIVAALGLLATVASLVPAAAASDGRNLTGLHDIDGNGWHADNYFRIEWDPNPPAWRGDVYYSIRGPAGEQLPGFGANPGYRSDYTTVSVPPTPGVYLFEAVNVDLKGSGGRPPAFLALHFDDARPAPVSIAAPDWVAAGTVVPVHLAHPAEPLPLSGIQGYAVSVDRSPAGAPCADARRCAAAELDLNDGIGGDATEVPAPPEGISYVHAFAVSGSGMHSATTGTTAIGVDGTPPRVSLEGVPAGWAAGPVRLRALAADPLSGMAPAGPGGPLTAISIDGGPPSPTPGAEASATVAGEGPHQVTYWGRDAVGNTGDGSLPFSPPASATVRIDETGPTVRFAAGDPGDPERIEATVADGLSGADPTRGQIALRRVGSAGRFEPLPTDVQRGRLVARWSSDDSPRGAYEFRAVGFDAAGNQAATTAAPGGGQFVLHNPVKREARLAFGFGAGQLVFQRCARADGARRCHRTVVRSFAKRPAARAIPCCHGAVVGGLLLDADRAPLAGQAVDIVETFAGGSHQDTRTTAVTSDGRGEFRAWLAPGPSREVTARFAGTHRLTRAGGRRLRLQVRAAVHLKVSTARVRVGGAPVVFSGRVVHPEARIPASGLPVELEFRLPGTAWSEFRTVQSDRGGRFRYSYSFSDDDSAGIRFLFRAFVPATGDWPFAPATSRPLAVTG